jgi:hypothetical protein
MPDLLPRPRHDVGPGSFSLVRHAAAPAALVASLVAVGCGDGSPDSSHRHPSSSAMSPLPLTGATAAGVRYRLQAGEALKGDDAPASWCLRLRYTGEIALVDDEFVHGVSTCGRAPAPRVSGEVTIDCAQRMVFVFGGAHETVEGVELVSESGRSVRARLGELPPRSGFAGKSFLLVADVGDLPGEVREEHTGRAAVARIPDEDALCAAVPGAPDGPQWSMTFPE